MYHLINRNINKLLTVATLGDIEGYLWLAEQVIQSNVTTNTDFQKQYKNYWRLNAARLSPEFCTHYFQTMEDNKHAQELNIKNIAQTLFEKPTHQNGRQSLQFSFATKLAHTLNPRLPIYDSMVESFYFFPVGSEGDPYSKKIERLCASYDFLIYEYERVLTAGLLEEAFQRCQEKFPLAKKCTKQRLIDLLIWKFVSDLKSGSLKTRDIIFYA